jgi:hypothetical protein
MKTADYVMQVFCIVKVLELHHPTREFYNKHMLVQLNGNINC